MSSFHAIPSVHGDDALSYLTPPFAQALSPSLPSILPVEVSSVTMNAGCSDWPSTLTAASHCTNPLWALSGEETPHELGGALPTHAPVTSEDIPPFASLLPNTTAMNIPTDPQLTCELLDFIHTLVHCQCTACRDCGSHEQDARSQGSVTWWGSCSWTSCVQFQE